jgi:hypothetical protein
MRKTGSELTSEMVGPAGSTSEGAFSCTKACGEDELCPAPGDLEELLLEDWAQATVDGRTAHRQKTANKKAAEDRNALNVMKNPVCQSS